jgi:hypothetical protein
LIDQIAAQVIVLDHEALGKLQLAEIAVGQANVTVCSVFEMKWLRVSRGNMRHAILPWGFSFLSLSTSQE